MSDFPRPESSASLLNGGPPCTNDADNLEQFVLGALEEVKTSGAKEIANQSIPFQPEAVEARSVVPANKKTNLYSDVTAENTGTTRGDVRVSFNHQRIDSTTGLVQEDAADIPELAEESMVTVEIPVVGAEYVYKYLNRYVLSTEQGNREVPEVASTNEDFFSERSLHESDTETGGCRLETKGETSVSATPVTAESFWNSGDDDDEELDTQLLARQLSNELKKYSIPQAVFAKKVLNRSQGTLSDILRKPKPWQELKGGKEIFKRMKKWLELPAVKKIPQLRSEGTFKPFHSQAQKVHSPNLSKRNL